jgi:hypothetical protein
MGSNLRRGIIGNGNAPAQASDVIKKIGRLPSARLLGQLAARPAGFYNTQKYTVML